MGPSTRQSGVVMMVWWWWFVWWWWWWWLVLLLMLLLFREGRTLCMLYPLSSTKASTRSFRSFTPTPHTPHTQHTSHPSQGRARELPDGEQAPAARRGTRRRRRRRWRGRGAAVRFGAAAGDGVPQVREGGAHGALLPGAERPRIPAGPRQGQSGGGMTLH